jgi:hypothetical protein
VIGGAFGTNRTTENGKATCCKKCKADARPCASKHYAEIFSDEPVARGEDKEIRLTVRKAPIKAIPFAAFIAFVSWQGAAVFRGRHDLSSLGVEQNPS